MKEMLLMNNSSRYLRPGCIVNLKEKNYCVRRLLNQEIVELIDNQRGQV